MKTLFVAAACAALVIPGAAQAQSYQSPAAGQHDNGPSYMDPYYYQYWSSRGRSPYFFGGPVYGYYGPRVYRERAVRMRGRECWKETDSRGYGYYTVCTR